MAEVKFDIVAEDLATPTLYTVVENTKSAVSSMNTAFGQLDATKTLELDASSAVQAANEARAAIDAIPDVSYKTVIVQYKTQASPVMDFSEGMAYIEERMASLPAEGTYTVNYENVPARGAVSDVQAPGGTARNISFSPTIQITSTGGKSGGELAAELDRALAEKWRYNRSELRRAMTA